MLWFPGDSLKVPLTTPQPSSPTYIWTSTEGTAGAAGITARRRSSSCGDDDSISKNSHHVMEKPVTSFEKSALANRSANGELLVWGPVVRTFWHPLNWKGLLLKGVTPEKNQTQSTNYITIRLALGSGGWYLVNFVNPNMNNYDHCFVKCKQKYMDVTRLDNVYIYIYK